MNKGTRFHFVPAPENDVAGPGFTAGAWTSEVSAKPLSGVLQSLAFGGREVRALQVRIPLSQHLHFAIRRVQRHVGKTIHLASFII